MSVPEGTIGIALAGGGHRASAWALGSLLALVDSGAARRVASIASVSGGSITNGYVAAHCEYNEPTSDFEEQVVRPLAHRLASDGTVFAHPEADDVKRGLYAFAKLSGVILLLLGATLVVLGAAWALEVDWLGHVVQALVFETLAAAFCMGWVVLFLLRRGPASLNGYDAFYPGKQLANLGRKTEHVLCATDLQCGEHVYLSGRFVYAYRFGVGHPGSLSLGHAVAASAAFPAAFPPVVISTELLGLKHGAAPHERLVLQDGGVYDNMGDQWFSGVRKRLSGKDDDRNSGARSEALRAVSALKTNPDELVVSNGAPSFPVSLFEYGWFPARELETLYRVGLALYDQTTAGRRSALLANVQLRRQRAAIIQIETSLTKALSTAPAATDDPAYPQRLATVRKLIHAPLGAAGEAVDWDALAARNSKVPTVLDPLDPDVVAALLQHATVLTAVQCHLYLAHPFPDEGDWVVKFGWHRFRRLAGCPTQF